ncbi:hypothetical protein [Microbacterium sp. K24]|uniref:hypothetical protein n=1 Tax=Microbacterium sp. K24 TaxID=2305446 RepID=UPI00109D39E7|nr:hypothetical protein [Microbacterium sp. K24]
MLRIEPEVLCRLAAERGWMHKTGRLAGTLNATAMAQQLGVSVSTVTRAYDTGAVGVVLLGKLKLVSGWSLDDLVSVVEATAA